jgi:hypothetical protein
MPEPLDALSRALDDRQGDIDKQTDYYTGERPKLTLSDPHIPSYAKIIDQARTPWASLIVDQAAERMAVTGFRVITPDDSDEDVEADGLAWDIWQANEGDMHSQSAFQAMLLHGVSYVLVEAGEDLPVLSFEHPALAITMPEPGGRRTAAALKRWSLNDHEDVAVLWTLDGATVYARDRRRSGKWLDVDEQPAAAGTVPMFAMRNEPDLLGGYRGDLEGMYPSLDRTAQSVADRITAQLYSSTKVRYLIGVEPDLDEDGNPTESTIRLATDRLLLIENPDAKAGVFDASDLRQFIEVARSDIAALAALARLPSYLLSGDLVNVSREALESLSQGLVSRVEQRQVWAAPALSGAMRLALQLAGDVRVENPRTRVEPIWAPVLEPAPAETAAAGAQLVQAGILSPTAVQEMVLGMSPSEREKASQYARQDALTQQGVNQIAALFTAPVVEQPVNGEAGGAGIGV